MVNKIHQNLGEQRLDTWLWAARFFKSRKIAHQAVIAGHVWINGNKTKPAKTVKKGDRLIVRRGYEKFEVDIIELCPKRVSAPMAQTLYTETEQSRQQREKQRELHKQNAIGAPFTKRRPGKRDRRQLMKLKKKYQDI